MAHYGSYGDALEGDDSGFEYTEIMGDGSDGDVEGDILGELLGEVDGDDSGAYVLVGAASAKTPAERAEAGDGSRSDGPPGPLGRAPALGPAPQRA